MSAFNLNHLPDSKTTHFRYRSPPIPTLPTVKLRPARVSWVVSGLLDFLDDLIERWRSTSVLFLTRLNEFDLFFPVVLGAELFLICPRSLWVSGVLVGFLGLEPC